jgi:hypothetical protein
VKTPETGGDRSGGEAGAATPGIAFVLSADLRERLADLQSMLGNLEDIRGRLEREMFSWDNAPLANALRMLHAGARELRFADLRTSWLHRALGRHVAPFERFASAVDRLSATAAALRMHALGMSAVFNDHNQAARRIFVELDEACSDITAEVDRCVAALEQMCDDINRQRVEGSADHRLATLAEAAQSYTQELKRLQGICSMVRDIDVRGLGILERRGALVEQAKAHTETLADEWIERVGEVAGDARAARSRMPGLPAAIETHDSAMKRLEAVLDACGALQGEEHLLAQQLEHMRTALIERE